MSDEDNQPFSPSASSSDAIDGLGTPPSMTDDNNTSTDPSDNDSDKSNGDSSPNINELLDIKTKALDQLSPIVGHLDQSPEEKFKTLMMMIQASDDQSLIKTAYEAAQQISDEKVKAQALLDVVNEINYFTRQSDN